MKIVALSMMTLMATAASAAAPQTVVSYACDAGTTATARYVTTPGGGVVVDYGGHSLAFKIASSGSGARYTTAAGPHAITPLEWWNKGRDATLSELTPNGNAGRIIATCHQGK